MSVWFCYITVSKMHAMSLAEEENVLYSKGNPLKIRTVTALKRI